MIISTRTGGVSPKQPGSKAHLNRTWGLGLSL